jgi:hypothetical protein
LFGRRTHLGGELDGGVNHVRQPNKLITGGTTLRKLIAAGFTAFLLAGAGAAVANPPQDADHHQPNDHGLCTAYYAGSDKGQEMKHKAGPFEDLVARADDGDDSTTDDLAVFCGEATPGNK